nr:MAG TPA: Transcription elongation factor [Caudoviricetes sp.]
MSEKTLIDRIVLADEQGHLQGKPLEGVTAAITAAVAEELAKHPEPSRPADARPVEVVAGGSIPALAEGEQERAFMVTAQATAPDGVTWLGGEAPGTAFRGLVVLRRVSDGTILGVSRSTESSDTPVVPPTPTPQPTPAALARPTVTTTAAAGAVTARWEPVAGADSYEIQVDTGEPSAAASPHTFTPTAANGTVKVRAVRGSERGPWGIAVYAAAVAQTESAVTGYATTWAHNGWIEANKSLSQYFKAEGATVTGWEYPRNSQTWEPVPSSDTAHYKPQPADKILVAQGVKIENEGDKVIITTAKPMGPGDAIGLDKSEAYGTLRFKVIDRGGTPTYICDQYPPIPEANGQFPSGRWDSAPVQAGDKLEIVHGPDNYMIGTVIRATGDRVKIYGFKVDDWAKTRLVWHGWHWESGSATLSKAA